MFHAFMGRCAANAALLPIVSLDEKLEQIALGLAVENEAFADPAVDIEATAIACQLASRLPHFLATLTKRQQYVAHQFYWLDRSQIDIGNELGVTRSAICHMLERISALGRTYFARHIH